MSATTAHPETQVFPGDSNMENALQTIVGIYHKYSTLQGPRDFLNNNEFKRLLTEQTPTFLQACERNRGGYLDKLFKETDINKDSELTFEEFTTVLSKVVDDAHRIMHREDRCGPDKD